MPEAREQVPLPPGLDLLWGRRERGKRGPRAGLSADAIVAAAIRIADAKGLEAVSMERVARKLGFTTMSLYRHVASKEELLQLMWNASALGAEDLVIEGDDWRLPAADVGHHPAGHARPPSVDHPDADGRSAGRAELAALRRARSRDARRDRPRGRRQAADHRPAQFLHAQRGPDGQRRGPRRRRGAGGGGRRARQVRRFRSSPCCGNCSTSRPTRGCTASPGPPLRPRSPNATSSSWASTASWTAWRRSSSARARAGQAERMAR